MVSVVSKPRLWVIIYNTFVFKRLRDINEETSGQQLPRRRSNSLPIPKIEVSIYQGNENKKQEQKDFIEVPEVKDVSLLAGNETQGTELFLLYSGVF